MTDPKASGGRRPALRASVLTVFRERPVAYISTAFLLLGLSVLTVPAYSEGPVLFGIALVHLAPAWIVALTNFRCRLKGRPTDWPRWLLITGLLNAALAGVVLALLVVVPDFGNLNPDVLLAIRVILGVTFPVAALILIGTTVPGLFSAVEWVLGQVPRVGARLTKWLPASRLYAWSLVSLILLSSFLAGFLQAVLDGDSIEIAFAAFLGIACILSVLARQTLWDSHPHPLLLRWLPHLPAWASLIAFLAMFIEGTTSVIRTISMGLDNFREDFLSVK